MWAKRIRQRQPPDLGWLTVIQPKQANIGVTTATITPDMKNTETDRRVFVKLEYRNIAG